MYRAPFRGFDQSGQGFAFRVQADPVQPLRSEHATREFDLRGAVIICDEAGLQSSRQGEELLRLAQNQDMRVIFVGDVRQHVPVEADDFLRVLETHSNLSRWEVTEIQRQQRAGYKEAVGMLSSGAARDGLAALDKLGWVHEGQGNYLMDAAGAYFQSTNDGKAWIAVWLSVFEDAEIFIN